MTKSGRGKRRAVPSKSPSSRSSDMDLSPLGRERLVRIGPGVRRRIEDDGRRQVRVHLDRSAVECLNEAALHLVPEASDIQSQVIGPEWLHVILARVVELDRSPQVTVVKMTEPDGGLDQALVETTLRRPAL